MRNSSPIKVVFKRFDKDLPVPEFQTSGAAAFDLYARETLTLEPGVVGLVPLNVAVQLPDGYWALMAARSSLVKRGLQLANGIGVFDWDFRGDGDEFRAALLNYTDVAVTVERGERIVQVVVLPRPAVELIEKDAFETDDRGGFGTTGKK